ncbi:MAG: signal recognition particle-docking protein FtsY [Chthoniobacterales bacterium]
MAIGFLKNLTRRFSSKPVDWDELEETLVRADLGIPLTLQIMERLQELPTPPKADTINEIVQRELIELFPPLNPLLRPHPARPRTILMLGVNGTGKTTTTAKLGYSLKKNRHTVLFAAADTFRAAAIEQLVSWGERLDIDVVKGQYQGDTAALCYDAYVSAHRRNIEYLICDTAGRLHTKSNLMQELNKVVRTLGKHHENCPDEKWLVIDSTTGSNALTQAKEFHEAVGLTGIVVTKLDGSGKGGVAAAIQKELNIPPRYIGTGEQPDNLQIFDREVFVKQML